MKRIEGGTNREELLAYRTQNPSRRLTGCEVPAKYDNVSPAMVNYLRHMRPFYVRRNVRFAVY